MNEMSLVCWLLLNFGPSNYPTSLSFLWKIQSMDVLCGVSLNKNIKMMLFREKRIDACAASGDCMAFIQKTENTFSCKNTLQAWVMHVAQSCSKVDNKYWSVISMCWHLSPLHHVPVNSFHITLCLASPTSFPRYADDTSKQSVINELALICHIRQYFGHLATKPV